MFCGRMFTPYTFVPLLKSSCELLLQNNFFVCKHHYVNELHYGILTEWPLPRTDWYFAKKLAEGFCLLHTYHTHIETHKQAKS